MPDPHPRSWSRGFTLIELVITVVVLSILAAVAVFFFTDLQYDARVAATRGPLAAYRESIQMTHLWLLKNRWPNGVQSVSLPNPAKRSVYAWSARPLGSAMEAGSFLLFPEGGAPRNRILPSDPYGVVSRATAPDGLTPAQFCDQELLNPAGADLDADGAADGWVYYRDRQFIHAFTTDCARSNPAAW
jgi:prepilin-type N-terminal cleavage/methylation domain-containing protein